MGRKASRARSPAASRAGQASQARACGTCRRSVRSARPQLLWPPSKPMRRSKLDASQGRMPRSHKPKQIPALPSCPPPRHDNASPRGRLPSDLVSPPPRTTCGPRAGLSDPIRKHTSPVLYALDRPDATHLASLCCQYNANGGAGRSGTPILFSQYLLILKGLHARFTSRLLLSVRA
jgi:hypothetical protein